MSLLDEWSVLRRAIHAYLANGGTAKALSDRTGVSRATLLDWAARIEPPETVSKAIIVMAELERPE